MKRKYTMRKNQDGKWAIFDLRGNRISDWFLWIEFSSRLEYLGYYIAKKEQGKWAIYNLHTGNQISDLFDYIEIGKKYYKARKGNKWALYDFQRNRISEFFDYISLYGLANGESDFYIAVEDNKYAIFYKDGTRISDWYDDIGPEGLVNGKSNYYLARKGRKAAIFHRNGERISEWFDVNPYEYRHFYGLIQGQSDFYIARKDDKYAIFHRDGERISKWFDVIWTNGLVEGKSDYYIAFKKGKCAIFHKDGKQISKWFIYINTYGLIDGSSDYYIAEKEYIKPATSYQSSTIIKKKAIFHKDGRQISKWFDTIGRTGLIDGRSDYFIVEEEEDEHLIKYAIFDKDGNQITSEWFDYIWEDGLVKGESDYFLAVKDGKFAIYHESGEKVSDDFDTAEIEKLNSLKFNDRYGTVEVYDSSGNLIKTIHFKPFKLNREDIIDYTKLLNI